MHVMVYFASSVQNSKTNCSRVLNQSLNTWIAEQELAMYRRSVHNCIELRKTCQNHGWTLKRVACTKKLIGFIVI